MDRPGQASRLDQGRSGPNRFRDLNLIKGPQSRAFSFVGPRVGSIGRQLSGKVRLSAVLPEGLPDRAGHVEERGKGISRGPCRWRWQCVHRVLLRSICCHAGLQARPPRKSWLSLHILRSRSRTYQGLQHGQGWTRLLHSSFRNGQGCAYLIWQSFRPIIEFHIGALSLVPRGDFPCLSRQLDSMQAKKGPGGPFAVLASPFIAEPALPE